MTIQAGMTLGGRYRLDERIAGGTVLAERRTGSIESQPIDAAHGVVERGIHAGEFLLGQRIGAVAGFDPGEALVIGGAVAFQHVAQILEGEREVGAGRLGLRSGVEMGHWFSSG